MKNLEYGLLEDIFGFVVVSYSCVQVIEDGVLIDVMLMVGEVGFKWLVVFIYVVWCDCVVWIEWDNCFQVQQDELG